MLSIHQAVSTPCRMQSTIHGPTLEEDHAHVHHRFQCPACSTLLIVSLVLTAELSVEDHVLLHHLGLGNPVMPERLLRLRPLGSQIPSIQCMVLRVQLHLDRCPRPANTSRLWATARPSTPSRSLSDDGMDRWRHSPRGQGISRIIWERSIPFGKGP